MAKKIVFASPEALEVQSGVLWLFYKNQTDRMPVKDAAAALNVTAAQLKTLWQQFGLGNPLSGEIRLEGDTFGRNLWHWCPPRNGRSCAASDKTVNRRPWIIPVLKRG